MTESKAEAMKIIEQMPNEKMDYVLRRLKDLQKEFEPPTEEDIAKSVAAYEELMEIVRKYNVHVPEDFDYKDEVAKAVLEKYESIA